METRQPLDRVYVVDEDGNALMPTKHFGKVRHMLKDGRATVYLRHPFTIQLHYKTPGKTQPIALGIDPGRAHIGVAAVDQKGEVVYAAKLETRNKEVSKLVGERAEHRHVSRRGERLRRKRRAKKNGTTKEFPDGRKLPGYEKGVLNVKDITNSEARFNNRRRRPKWLTPTARHLKQTHENLISHIRRFLPVTDVPIEHNKFAFMLMEDGTVRGTDFQNGRMKGYASVNEYVKARQNYECELCGNPIEHVHHIKPRREGGSNAPENLVGLCEKCHAAVHTGSKKINAEGFKKKYAGASVLNQALPHFIRWLEKELGPEHIRTCAGWETKTERKRLGPPKDHHADAAAILSACGFAVGGGNQPALQAPCSIMQFRSHDRQIIHAQKERTYKVRGEDGKLVVVAKNRKPRFGQKGMPALNEWLEKETQRVGRRKARRELSKLTVVKSESSRNRLDRDLPGTIFRFEGKAFVLRGNSNGGFYFYAVGYGDKRFPVPKCEILSKRGLVYI